MAACPPAVHAGGAGGGAKPSHAVGEGVPVGAVSVWRSANHILHSSPGPVAVLWRG